MSEITEPQAPSEAMIEAGRLAIGNAGRETFVNSLGYCMMLGMLGTDPETTQEQGNELLREAARRAYAAMRAASPDQTNGLLREALDVIDRLLDYALVHDTGLVEHADEGRQSPLVTAAKHALAKIDAALASTPTARIEESEHED